MKWQKLNTSGYFQEQSLANLTSSLEVALQIAKQKKIRKICPVIMVKLILGETSAKKIQQVSLSNDTIKRRISLMATDVNSKSLRK